MKKLFFLSCLFVILFCLPTTAQQPKPKPYSFKITDIKARLFYDFAEKFSSQDIINDKNFTLFNTVIGEGDAEGFSETTLGVIEITYGGIDDRNGGQLVIEARGYKNKLLFRRSTFVSYVDKTPGLKKYVPFIIYDTGCAEITITAKLYKDDQPKSPLLNQMTKKIPFVCGD